MLAGTLRNGRAIARHPDATVLPDLPRFEVRAARPIDLQADGESLGQETSVAFAWQPEALPLLV
jgi:diacylglycerol kinase family enzyme